MGQEMSCTSRGKFPQSFDEGFDRFVERLDNLLTPQAQPVPYEVYISTDAPQAITPGPLCREYMSSSLWTHRDATRIVVEGANHFWAKGKAAEALAMLLDPNGVPMRASAEGDVPQMCSGNGTGSAPGGRVRPQGLRGRARFDGLD